MSLSRFGIYELLVVLLIVGCIVSNYIWLKMDKFPLEGHELIGEITPAVVLYRQLIGLKIPNMPFYSFFRPNSLPPLSFVIVALFYFLFGPMGQMAVMVNSIYIIITLVCVYLIGKNIFNKRIGLLSAFILSSFPGFISYSRQYWIEFGLMAYVGLDLYFLLKTNLFARRRYSILLGISLAFSFLHKPEFVLFMIGPLALVTFKSGVLRDILRARWTREGANFVLILTLWFGLSSFWWVGNVGAISARILKIMFSDDRAPNISYSQRIFSHESLTFYPHHIAVMIDKFFSTLLCLAISYTMIKAIIRCKERLYLMCLILSFCAPLPILTFTGMKGPAHILSIFVPASILISSGIYFLKGAAFKIALAGLIIAYGLTVHFRSFYPAENFFPRYSVRIPMELKSFILRLTYPQATYVTNLSFPPRQEHIEDVIKEILEYIRIDSYRSKRPFPGVFVAFHEMHKMCFKNCTFEYYGLIGGYIIRFSSCFRPMRDISECDYLVIDKSEEAPIEDIFGKYSELDRGIEAKNFKEIFKGGLKGFNLIKVYNISGSNTAIYIYRKESVSQLLEFLIMMRSKMIC